MHYLKEMISSKNSKVSIKVASENDIIDINLCAEEYLQLLEDFEVKYSKGDYFILIAYYDNILAAVLVAEKRIHKVDSLETIVPKSRLCLIYVNSLYRKKQIASRLLDFFKKVQKEKGIASIFVELPLKYQKGIKFFEKNDFQITGKNKDKFYLEFYLWNDFGLRMSDFLSKDLNDIFD